VTNAVGNRNFVNEMRNCSMDPLNPFLFFPFSGEVGGGGAGVEFLDFFVPNVFPMSFQLVFQVLQCVPQLVLNSTSPCPLWFPQCCPLGT
jgi:hypothetical protein